MSFRRSTRKKQIPLAEVSDLPRQGVVTLFGYGIKVHVDRGHLTFQDGIGTDRRQGRFSRIRHGLRRLVVVGSDGFVSLAALRWLADQNAAFVMLDRDGSVIATTGPVRPSDGRLRRAQGLAHDSGAALKISHDLIAHKISAQANLACEVFKNPKAADSIETTRRSLDSAKTIQEVRRFEAHAAQLYWSLWNDLQINFPQEDIRHVPDHWRTFGTRKSPITGSARLAVNPPNAMLNYLYALLESEARLAIAALGLDPGLGMLHADTQARDALACDLMEPVRPKVDAYLLDWLRRGLINRRWFFEQRDGNCRLMAPLAAHLAETTHIWARAVAPFAEDISRTLWSTTRKPSQWFAPATRLTQERKRRSEPRSGMQSESAKLPVMCRSCGGAVTAGHTHCNKCAIPIASRALVEYAKLGRVATHKPEAEALRAATMRRHEAEKRGWNPQSLPKWLNLKLYKEQVVPRLRDTSVPTIIRALGVSEPYATNLRQGRRIPHPRHWEKLAQLAGLSSRKPTVA